MEYIANAAPIVVGLAFGLFFGRLLNAIVVYWEGTATAVKWSTVGIGFLVGAGGGAALFRLLSGPNQPLLYLLGLGIGMIVAFFLVKVPPRYTLDMFKQVVSMSDALRPEVPDADKRALLILISLEPAKAIRGVDEAMLASQLEKAADTLGASTHPPEQDETLGHLQ